MPQAARKQVNEPASELCVAFELSEKSCELVFSDGVRTSEKGAPARELRHCRISRSHSRRTPTNAAANGSLL